MKRFLDWLPVALGVALLLVLVSLQWQRIVRGQNDFAGLYAGATLVGTPELYSLQANEAVIQSVLGTTMESVTYTRPPFYAVLLKPLSFLPYLTAYGIYCAACLASILWFVFRFSKECPSLPLFTSLCIPVAAFLPQGQDTPFLLVFAGSSVLLARQKKNFWAGLILSLCAIKFHLFLLVPLMLLTKKRWSILCGAVSGTGILFLLGVVVAGAETSAMYIRVLGNPWINFGTEMMPNLHGLAGSFKAGSVFELGMSGVVVLAFLWTCFRTDDYELLFALSILCGLLISFHSGIGDDVLLLLVFVLIAGAQVDKSLRIIMSLCLTPLPYFTGLSISVTLPLLFLLTVALAVVSVENGHRRSLAPASPTPCLP